MIYRLHLLMKDWREMGSCMEGGYRMDANGDALSYTFGVGVQVISTASKKEAPDYNPSLSYQMNQQTPFLQYQEFHLAYDTQQLNKQMISFSQQQLLALQHIMQSKQLKVDAAVRGECSIHPMRSHQQKEGIEDLGKSGKQDKTITDKEKTSLQTKRKLSDLMTQIDQLAIPDQKKTINQLATLREALLAHRGVLGF